MRQATAVILIICLFSSSAFAASNKASIKSKAASEFAKLERTEFGRNLLNTIELSARSKEPVQNILDLLDEIETQLHEDGEAADTLHADFQNRCENDLESIQGELAVATEAIQEAQEDLTIAVPKYQQLSEDRDRLDEEIEDLNDQLIDLYNTREEEADTYANNIQEIEEALAVFTNARQVFERIAEDFPESVAETVEDSDDSDEDNEDEDEDDGDDYDAADEVGSGDDDEDDEDVDEDEEEALEAYYNGEDADEEEDEEEDDESDDEDEEDEDSEFVQIRSKKLATAKVANTFAEVSSTLKKVSYRKRGFTAIAKMFAQITSRAENILANQQLVIRILDLFDDIAENLNEQAVNERNAEDVRIDVYNSQVSSLRKNQGELQAQIDNTNYELNSLDTRIQYAQNKLEENTRTASDKTDQYEDTSSECQDENANYERASEDRADELSTIGDVRKIVNGKLNNLLNYVEDRVADELDE